MRETSGVSEIVKDPLEMSPLKAKEVQDLGYNQAKVGKDVPGGGSHL